jgi:hypothetical protein
MILTHNSDLYTVDPLPIWLLSNVCGDTNGVWNDHGTPRAGIARQDQMEAMNGNQNGGRN